MMNKLKKNNGESIAEVLVSSLIVSLAFIMILTMINASKNIITLSIERQQNYYNQRNAFEAGQCTTSDGKVIIESTGMNNVSSMHNDISVKVQTTTILETNETLIQYEKVGN